MGRLTSNGRRILLTAPPLLFAGCAAATVDLPIDGDADGLTNAQEATIGTDPEVADTDNDGYLDGAEVKDNTDPLDATDHPYIGNWPIDACRHDIQGTGTSEGDVSTDFTLQDQYGEDVTLHDFCGKVVLIENAAFW